MLFDDNDDNDVNVKVCLFLTTARSLVPQTSSKNRASIFGSPTCKGPTVHKEQHDAFVLEMLERSMMGAPHLVIQTGDNVLSGLHF